MDGDTPKAFADLHRLLTAQVASRWAAYVVGCLGVLMHERGLRLQQCLAILVSSDIPEGMAMTGSSGWNTVVCNFLFWNSLESRQRLGVLGCIGGGCNARLECCIEAAAGR